MSGEDMKTRIFITGVSGYLGAAIAARLARAGHEVYGLTRNADRARALASSGIHALVGDLAAPSDWIGALNNADAVVHTAFDPNAENGPAERDQQALDLIRTAALDGRVRKLLYTSGIWVHGAGQGKVVDESTPLHPLEIVSWRAAHEQIALDLATHEVQTVILRPGMVYGGGRGVFSRWFHEARDHHTVTYYGDGSQHWACVHRDDVAEAFALAFEHARGGSSYIVADDTRNTVKELAEAVAKATRSTAKPWAAEDLVKTMGLFGKALLNDLEVSAGRAKRELGWVPRHTSFAAEAPALVAEWKATREAKVA